MVVAKWEKFTKLYEPHDGTTKLCTYGALFIMFVKLEEEDVSTFLASMDDVITADHLIYFIFLQFPRPRTYFLRLC